jgi:hypothetical protein
MNISVALLFFAIVLLFFANRDVSVLISDSLSDLRWSSYHPSPEALFSHEDWIVTRRGNEENDQQKS